MTTRNRCTIGQTAHRAILLVVMTVLITGLFAVNAYARSVELVFDGETVRVDAYRIDGTDYLSVPQLLDAFGARHDLDESAQRLRAELDGRIWTFWAHSSVVGIDGEVGSLGRPALIRDREIVAPVRTLALLLDQFSGMHAVVQGRNLRITDRETAVQGYRIDTRRNGVLIEIDVNAFPPFESFISEGNWINVTLHHTRVVPARLNARKPHRAVRQVSATQFEESAQISFRMRDPVDKYMITAAESPRRLVILVGDTSAAWSSTAVAPPPDMGYSDNPVNVIVIDAGHGGVDPGGTGLRRNAREHIFVLEIAERTAKLFRKDARFDVVMTRTGDNAVSVNERAGIANAAGGDVLISIHTGHWEHGGTGGCQTFFYGHATNDGASEYAAFENAMSAMVAETADATGNGALAVAPVYGGYQQSSAAIAERIQKRFETRLDIPSRGVDQAEFALLNRVDMPAVLVQPACLGNLSEEKLLDRRSFQKRVAKAIYEGVIMYRDDFASAP